MKLKLELIVQEQLTMKGLEHCTLVVGFFLASCTTATTNQNPGERTLRTSMLGSLQRQPVRPLGPASEIVAVHKVDENVWRAELAPSQAYLIIARLLAQRYVIAQTDRKQMQVKTEWDKFFIDGRLFRNKISASIFPVNSRATELVIKNTVEYYAVENTKETALQENSWLPSPDVTDEIARLSLEFSKHASTVANAQPDLRTRQ